MLLVLAVFYMAEIKITPVKKVNLTEQGLYIINSPTANAAIAADGRFAIFDSAENQIALFSENGSLLKRSGAKGEGPGEFQYFGQIQWIEDKNIWAVVDWGNARVSRWGPDGALLSEVKIPLPGTGGSVAFIDSETMVYSDFIFGAFGANPQVIKYDLEQQKPTKLYEHSLPQKTPIIHLQSGGVQICEWDPTVVYSIGTHFMAVVFGAEGLVRLTDFEGKEFAPPFFPKLRRYSITDEDLLSQKDRLPLAIQSALGGNFKKPDSWPLVSYIVVDTQDNLWIYGAKRFKEFYPVMVYTPQGDLIAEGQMTRHPIKITDKHIFFIDAGSDEELFLVKSGYAFD